MSKRFKLHFSYDEDQGVIEEYDTLTEALISLGKFAKEYEEVTNNIRGGVFDFKYGRIAVIVAEDQGVMAAVEDMNNRRKRKLLES